jgi:multicomponent Na+:H+ antiporter subunit D
MSPAEMRAVNVDADWFYRKGGGLFYRVMDISMNGINRIADRVIVGELTGSMCRIFQRWPEVLCLGVMIPLWSVTGTRGKDLHGKIERTRSALQTHTSPIGISAAMATIFLVLIYLLM